MTAAKKASPEKITAVSTSVIALATVVGVGGGLAYYLDRILGAELGYLVLVEIIYILIIILFVYIILPKIK